MDSYKYHCGSNTFHVLQIKPCFAAKMNRLIEMKSNWPEMRVAARQFVSDRFSLEKQTDNLIAKYRII